MLSLKDKYAAEAEAEFKELTENKKKVEPLKVKTTDKTYGKKK